MIQIKSLTLGVVNTNSYLIGDTESGRAVLIDPVDDAPRLAKWAADAGWKIELILATHGHFDHIMASADLKAMTKAPFAIHPNDIYLLEEMPQRGIQFTGVPFPEAAVIDRLLTTEPEVIEVGAIRLETLFTPGHSPGHISFYLPSEKTVFSGDALFAGSIGRTDLPGGDHQKLIASIRQKLVPLGDDVVVLSGHGGRTTMGKEIRTNPFLQ